MLSRCSQTTVRMTQEEYEMIRLINLVVVFDNDGGRS